MIYFTSDTHWGHTNIIKYCNRPFSNVGEMDNTIIDNINAVVRSQDILYHLGDFAFRNTKNLSEYRDRINCSNIHLILGNHDYLRLADKKLFSTISEKKEIRHAKQTLVLCHYAMRIWNKSHYGSIHLFGHSHGNLDAYGKSFDVGVDCWKFQPLSIDFIFKQAENMNCIGHH